MANGGAPHDPPDAAQTLEARDSVSPGFHVATDRNLIVPDARAASYSGVPASSGRGEGKHSGRPRNRAQPSYGSP
jgi:hypothetical protein